MPSAPALEVTKALTDSAAIVSDARAITVGALQAWGCDEEVIDDAIVVVSELVTNAVVHTRSPGKLRLALADPPEGPALRIEVSDGSTDSLQPRPSDLHAPGGRGLLIVRALTARHGTLKTSDGKTVWVELPLRR